ncbi:MAG: DUF4340 domain-containing protein, partial [Proteobacteria bacterium]|nr:DUF4340 domain-containing protein [Pseudomonadota bacterium]
MKRELIKIGISLLVLLGIAIPLSLHREKKIARLEAEDLGEKFIQFEIKDLQKIKVINKGGEVEMVRRKKDATGKYEDEFGSRDFEFKNKPEWIVVQPYRAIADTFMIETLYDQMKELRQQKVIQENKDLKKDYGLDPAAVSLQFFKDNGDQPSHTLEVGDENNAATSYYYSSSDKPGIYLGERALQPFREQNVHEWREKKVIGFSNVADVEKISVRNPSGKDLSFEATKDKANWKIGPVTDNLAGDVAAIQGFLAHIDGVRSSQILDDESILKNSKLVGEVSLSIKDVKDPVVYRVYTGPKDSHLSYVQRSDLKPIFTIAEDPQFLPTFQEVVGKKLINKSFSDMTSVKIIQPKITTEVVRDKESWKIQKPVEDAANPRRLQSIVQALAEVNPLLYLKNKVLNSSDQRFRFEFGLMDQSVNAVTLYQQGKEFFAKIEDENKTRIVSLYKIPEEIYEHISRLRNTELVPVVKESITKIVFTRGNSKVEIENNKKTQSWFLKTLENVPTAVSMKWRDQIIPEEFFNRIS